MKHQIVWVESRWALESGPWFHSLPPFEVDSRSGLDHSINCSLSKTNFNK
ncbi:hypothetical protein Hanom_Chr01g00076651 [Helianthus anomalus]